jgi:hypothetical protein
MKLSGSQQKQVFEAIKGAFNKGELKQIVLFNLDENLDDFATGSDLSTVVLDLLDHARKTGRTRDLIEAVIEERPGNEAIQALSALISPVPLNPPAVSEQSASQATSSPGMDKPQEKPKKALKIFISYAHKDEIFKDELITMLASMQRRGVIDAWQDRLIEPGDEWFPSIQKAMDECDLALLLVSGNFLASRFISSEEVPKLLQRRRAEGMRVIPIIIRPCTWQSEPILKDLQALPRDGKAVITFPEATGERDQAWLDIAKAIEKFA